MAEGKSPKQKRLDQLEAWWKLAESANRNFLVQAKEDLGFYMPGEGQWDSNDLTILKNENRPALTFNHLFPLINLVSGYQRQNRQDIKVYNRKGGTKAVADILSELIKHIEDNCYGDAEESMAFLLGLITGRGWLGVNTNYDDEILTGDMTIESLSPFRIYPDPFCERYDMSDGQFIFKIAWLPKSRLELAFPEKAGEFEDMSVGESDKEPIPFSEGDMYHDAESQEATVNDIEKYRYRVKECWHREFKEDKFLVGIDSGTVKKVDLPMAKIKAILDQHKRIKLIKRVRPMMNLTTYVGNVEIQHVENPLTGAMQFPIVPFYCYWIDGKNFGMITQLKDAQRELNKRVSQALHHLNQSANSGYTADADATTNWQEIEDNVGTPGYIKKIKPGSKFEKDKPTEISEGHLKLAQAGKQNIRDVSGVNPDLAGATEDKGVSGYLMELRRNQGLISIESIFDNYRLTKQILGTRLVDMIQKTDVYTREEILSMVIDGEVKEYPVNTQVTVGAVDTIKNDLTVGKYKVAISESKKSPTARARDFQMLVEAVKAGLPIPPQILVDASDLPMKDEIKAALPGAAPGAGMPPKPGAGGPPVALPPGAPVK